jgi:hypothetical protein
MQPLYKIMRDPSKTFRDVTEIGVSYIVFTDGSRYYAKNGSTGMIEFIDTDASNLMQNVVNALAGRGGRIFIRSGVYNITKPVKLIPNLVIEGEAPGFMKVDVADETVYPTQALGVTLNITNTSVSHVFYYYDDSYWIRNVEISKVAVRGGGLLLLGNQGEKWGGHNIRIRDVACKPDPLYSSPISTYCLDIWHSILILAEHVYAYNMPVLRFGTDFTTKTWNFGNSVFIDIFSTNPPTGTPHIHLWAKGKDGKTMLNLIVIIRPQTLHGGAGILIEGDDAYVRWVTMLGVNVEDGDTGGMVKVMGNTEAITLDMHYDGLVRLCKNEAGSFKAVPQIISVYGNYDRDSKGNIKLYESDCQTWNTGSVILSINVGRIFGIARLLDGIIPSWVFYPDMPVLINENNPTNPWDITSIAGSGRYGDVNNPYLRQVIYFGVPSGKTLNAGVNSYKFYTRALPVAGVKAGGSIIVFKLSGWEQANLDVQARVTGYNSTYNCYEVTVDIINRSDSAVTLSSDLVFAVWTLSLLYQG